MRSGVLCTVRAEVLEARKVGGCSLPVSEERTRRFVVKWPPAWELAS
jgi:hypothetical protein